MANLSSLPLARLGVMSQAQSPLPRPREISRQLAQKEGLQDPRLRGDQRMSETFKARRCGRGTWYRDIMASLTLNGPGRWDSEHDWKGKGG